MTPTTPPRHKKRGEINTRSPLPLSQRKISRRKPQCGVSAGTGFAFSHKRAKPKTGQNADHRVRPRLHPGSRDVNKLQALGWSVIIRVLKTWRTILTNIRAVWQEDVFRIPHRILEYFIECFKHFFLKRKPKGKKVILDIMIIFIISAQQTRQWESRCALSLFGIKPDLIEADYKLHSDADHRSTVAFS